MKLIIDTQYRENYGAHDWNGEGVCPQYWKNKGGSTFVVEHTFTSISPEQVAAIINTLRPVIEQRDDYSTVEIIDWQIVADDFVTHDEGLELEFEGHISHPSPRINLKGERVNPRYVPRPTVR